MSIRDHYENARENPATYALAALWVAVYIAMLFCQARGLTPGNDPRLLGELGPLGIGAISEPTGQAFGAWNAAQILSGQIWRTITATFVHFGLVHIALNLFGLLQLGRLIEEWYGPQILTGVVLAIGFLGNGLAALARPIVGTPTISTLTITSGGGSTVIFGMIGLVAMVGRRSRSRMGRYLYNQMLGLLAFNFLIGLTIPQIDNFAHAGGAIAGAIIGRFHHLLLNWKDSRPRVCKIIVSLSILTLIGGIYGQLWVHKIDKSLISMERSVMEFERLQKSLTEIQVRYVSRAALGLQSFQIIPPKGRNITGQPPLILPIPETAIQENVDQLKKAIDFTDKEVKSIQTDKLTTAWQPIVIQTRLAISRPPSREEVEQVIKQLNEFNKLINAEIDIKKVAFYKTASRLILWRTPWPNIAWTNMGPVIKSQSIPQQPGNAIPPVNGATGLPPR